MNVTIPCSCRAELSPGQTVCDACNAPVPARLREALLDRLAGSHSRYREARNATRLGAVTLLVIAAGHVGMGLLVFFVSGSRGVETRAQTVGGALRLGEELVLACTFVAFYVVAKARPVRALGTALVLWLTLEIVHVLMAPGPRILALATSPGRTFVTFTLLMALVHGLLGALRARRIVAAVGGDFITSRR